MIRNHCPGAKVLALEGISHEKISFNIIFAIHSFVIVLDILRFVNCTPPLNMHFIKL